MRVTKLVRQGKDRLKEGCFSFQMWRGKLKIVTLDA